LISEHKPQKYGTQLKQNKKGVYIPLPIESPQSVDIRRASMGMPPMKYYLREINDTAIVEATVSQGK